MQCLTERNAFELVAIEKTLSLDIAIQSKKNIQHIRENEKLAIKTITGILIMFNEYFNVGSKMSEIQAIQTASLFLEQYPVDSIEDLILCLKKAKLGQYGKIYNKIDGSMIFEWFGKYLDEKYQRLEQIKQNEKFTAVETSQNLLIPEQLQLIQTIADSKLKTKKNQANIERISDKTHFENFQKNIKLYTVPELISLKSSYKAQNKTSIYTNYNHYIEVITKRISELENLKT